MQITWSRRKNILPKLPKTTAQEKGPAFGFGLLAAVYVGENRTPSPKCRRDCRMCTAVNALATKISKIS
jgi:hypothetical protein